MRYEKLVGLNVTDDNTYQAYREGMGPILKTYGGYFSYDFKIKETLSSESDHVINRVFTISFPSEAAMDEFFANEDYKKVRDQFFDKSVDGTSIIAGYKK